MRASLRSIIITTFIAYAFILPLVSAIARNHTIDDVFGDDNSGALPTYSPGTAWHRGDQCTACLVKPDASQAFNGTWHDATHNVADTQPVFMDLSYNGSAIYVYGILANHIPSTTTATNLTFTLDGAVVGTFVHVPDNSSNFVYNVPFYANSSVPLGEHTLHIESNAVTQSALVLFDYAVYTIDDDTTSTSSSATSSPSTSSTTPTVSSTSKPTGSSTSTPTISPTPSHTPSPLPSKSNKAAIAIGATFGSVLLLALLALVYLKFARRYTYRRRGAADAIRRSSRREIDADEFTFVSAAELLPPVPPPVPFILEGYEGAVGASGRDGSGSMLIPATPTKSVSEWNGHHMGSLSNGVGLNHHDNSADPLPPLSTSTSSSNHSLSLAGHQSMPSDTTNSMSLPHHHDSGFSPPLQPLPPTPGWNGDRQQRSLPSPRIGGGDGKTPNTLSLRAVNAVSTDYSTVSASVAQPQSPTPSQSQSQPSPRRRPSDEDLMEQVRSLAVELEWLRASGVLEPPPSYPGQPQNHTAS